MTYYYIYYFYMLRDDHTKLLKSMLFVIKPLWFYYCIKSHACSETSAIHNIPSLDSEPKYSKQSSHVAEVQWHSKHKAHELWAQHQDLSELTGCNIDEGYRNTSHSLYISLWINFWYGMSRKLSLLPNLLQPSQSVTWLSPHILKPTV